MIFLSALERRDVAASAGYPYDTAVLSRLSRLELGAPVTMFCGDNGCGKTTLIELMAAKLRAERISTGNPVLTDAQRRIRSAADGFRISMKGKPRHCFLFTAEGFTKYIDYVVAEKEYARRELDALPGQYGSDYARELAAQPYAGTLAALQGLYERPLEAQSHGQGFLEFFQSRLRPDGLYLMDEPEAALSYVNQLALIYLMQDAVRAGSQFVLATHSPILTACPGAALYEMEEGALTQKSYPELRSIQFLKRFLSNPESILSED